MSDNARRGAIQIIKILYRNPLHEKPRAAKKSLARSQDWLQRRTGTPP